MLRTTGVEQKIIELLQRRTVNCRTSGIAPYGFPYSAPAPNSIFQWGFRLEFDPIRTSCLRATHPVKRVLLYCILHFYRNRHKRHHGSDCLM